MKRQAALLLLNYMVSYHHYNAFEFLYNSHLGMKDDLTNKIVGSIRAKGGFPLVVKVSHIRPLSKDSC